MTGEINFQTHVAVHRKYHIAVHLMAFIAVLQILMFALAVENVIPPIQVGDLRGYYSEMLMLQDEAEGRLAGSR